jgi:hypothetical protein
MDNKVVHIFNSLSEDVKKTLKDLASAVKVEMAEDPAAPAKQMAEVPLADGSVIKVTDLNVGGEVMVVTPEGEIPAPEGEHTLADGSVIVVAKEGEKSVITEVKPAEAMKKEEPAKDVAMEAVKNLKSEYEAKIKDIEAKFNSEIEKIKLSVSQTKANLVKTVEVVEAMAAIPTDEPAKKPETVSTKKDKLNWLNK